MSAIDKATLGFCFLAFTLHNLDNPFMAVPLAILSLANFVLCGVALGRLA